MIYHFYRASHASVVVTGAVITVHQGSGAFYQCTAQRRKRDDDPYLGNFSPTDIKDFVARGLWLVDDELNVTPGL